MNRSAMTHPPMFTPRIHSCLLFWLCVSDMILNYPFSRLPMAIEVKIYCCFFFCFRIYPNLPELHQRWKMRRFRFRHIWVWTRNDDVFNFFRLILPLRGISNRSRKTCKRGDWEIKKFMIGIINHWRKAPYASQMMGTCGMSSPSLAPSGSLWNSAVR